MQYNGEYAQKWLVEAVHFTIKLNRNDNILNEIFKLSQIEIDVDTFLLEIEAYLQRNSDIKYDKKRSPVELTNFINTWVYYSIYWACDLKDTDRKNHKKLRIITRMALEFHYRYIKYITIIKEGSRINIKSLEYAAITTGRTIEILAQFVKKKSAYITEKYFPEDLNDCFSHFINIVQNDYIEKKCFFIKRNTDGQQELFVKYDNPDIGISFQLLPSRRLLNGSKKAIGNKLEDENTKITEYLAQGYVDYTRMVTLETYRGKKKNKATVKNRLSDQCTQEEKLILDIADRVQNDNEEIIEKSIEQGPKIRSSLEADIKVIPDRYKQRMINRAFSSSVSHQNLMLTGAYNVPPLENLSLFLTHLSSDRLDVGFSEKNLFISVFMLSLLLGASYQEIIALLTDGKSNLYSINLEKKLLNVKLDNKLFGSAIEGFSLKTGKNISFKLPAGIVQIYKYIKKQISTLPEYAQKSLYEKEKQYNLFIEDKKDSSFAYVSFDVSNLWKILSTYSKNQFENSIASLFCIGKYSTLDRSALSYTSTHKSGQIHSNFLNSICNNLGISKCVGRIIVANEVVQEEEYLFDKKMEYIGSSRLVKQEDVKKFFSLMRRALMAEDDEIKYFNLYAVYARYGLGLLMATRYGKESCSLKNLTYELNLIRIIEKSDAKQDGVRFIPLCRKAKSIIVEYKLLCGNFGFSDDNIYFFDGKKRRILYGGNKKSLVDIFNREYDLDQYILDFIQNVPLNFGRHIAMKVAIENNFNMYYIQTMMGHYTKGTEQFGSVSTTDSQDYILKTIAFFDKIGKIYGI